MHTINVYILIFYCVINFVKSESCQDFQPQNLVRPSAVGRWHLTKSVKINGNETQRNTCGFFNTEPPCKCIGVNINSTLSPPFVSRYTLHNFGYNERLNFYAYTAIDITLISKQHSIYNAFVPLANVNFTIAVVGTDNYSSWMTLVMCDELKDMNGENNQLIWIITRSPQPSPTVTSNACKVIQPQLKKKNITLIDISQENCPQVL